MSFLNLAIWKISKFESITASHPPVDNKSITKKCDAADILGLLVDLVVLTSSFDGLNVFGIHHRRVVTCIKLMNTLNNFEKLSSIIPVLL